MRNTKACTLSRANNFPSSLKTTAAPNQISSSTKCLRFLPCWRPKHKKTISELGARATQSERKTTKATKKNRAEIYESSSSSSSSCPLRATTTPSQNPIFDLKPRVFPPQSAAPCSRTLLCYLRLMERNNQFPGSEVVSDNVFTHQSRNSERSDVVHQFNNF